MSELVLDPAQSRLTVHTFAEGLMARLAHDLELTWTGLSGTASRADGSARVEAPLAGLLVRGVLGKDGRVDERALSASDHRSMVDKMRGDVFHARGGEGILRVEATQARAVVVMPAGRSLTVPLSARLADDGATLRVTGEVTLSLAALGSDAIKGPMNAFRVKDAVRVAFDLRFAGV
ncbi:MAG: hypothetical protein JWP97_4234 [Labilithrix sp.]|nr:hypothetical protein [Labilithrix sp.]